MSLALSLAPMSTAGEVSDKESSDSLVEISAEAFTRRGAAVESPISVKRVVDNGEDGKEELCEVVIDVSSDEEEEIVSRLQAVGGERDEVSGEEDEEVVVLKLEGMGMRKVEKNVSLIREELESMTVEELEKSFEGSCSRLQRCFESLMTMFSGECAHMVDPLVQQSLMGVHSLQSVYNSGSLKDAEQSWNSLLRLLVHIRSHYRVLLTDEQMKEIDVAVGSLVSDFQKKNDTSGDGNGSAKLTESTGFSKLELPVTLRNGVLSYAKAKYREGTLQLPTQENPEPLRMLQPTGVGIGSALPSQAVNPMLHAKGTTFHSRARDSLMAVSSYHQKFSGITFPPSNRLPSPTPSAEGSSNDDDNLGEVSSSSDASNNISVNSASPFHCSYPATNSNVQQKAPTNMFGLIGSFSSSEIKTAAKSRDPRLKFMKTDTGNASVQSRPVGAAQNPLKRKLGDETLLDECSLKRQGKRLADYIEMHKEISMKNNVAQSEIKMDSPVNTGGPAASLPSLVNIASLNSSEFGYKQVRETQLPAQAVPMNVSTGTGRINMKLLDPCCTFQNHVVWAASEQANPCGNLSSDNQIGKHLLEVREERELAQTSVLPSQPIARPIISQQLSEHLKNNSTSVPGSQTTTTPGEIAPQSSNPLGDVAHLVYGFGDQQKAAIQKERARRIDEQNKMFAARKLCLVLDLDHTLLNSVMFADVDPAYEVILRKKEKLDRQKQQRHLFRFKHMGMWTKLRPGIWKFLEKASKLFELHLCTMGTKMYATEMAKVLDPTGLLFAGRVISRGDDSDHFDGDERVPKTKDLDGVLGMESAVVIIDDSIRVWPHNKLNLILVERYTYFPGSRRQFGLQGPSLLEINHDERPENGTLASSLAVIERLHQNFFTHQCLSDVDVRSLLATEQRRILSGCRIVFSRIFPVGEKNPHQHPLWKIAEQFGAVCTCQMDESVTHVVANSLGTDKVKWALSTGRFVVHPGWVEASALLYRRANERDFAVKP